MEWLRKSEWLRLGYVHLYKVHSSSVNDYFLYIPLSQVFLITCNGLER